MPKFCKCEISKDRSGAGTTFDWPNSHDEEIHNVVYYENKGNSVEHAVSIVPDDFDFSQSGYTELTASEAKTEIDGYVQQDKDMGVPDYEDLPDSIKSGDSAPGNISGATKQEFIDHVSSNRQTIIDRHA